MRIAKDERRDVRSATRSRTATGPRATTATRRRCTGALRDGQVVPMSWHCEDAAINYSQLPVVRERWHADRRRPARALRHLRRLGHVLLHERRVQALGRLPRSRSTSASGDGSSTRRCWAAWVDAKREIGRVAVEHGGSITACHGSCREGEVDLVPVELGGGVRGDEDDQAGARPEQHHEPGQVPARPGVRGGGLMLGFRLSAQKPPEAQRVTDGVDQRLRARLRDRSGAHDRARRQQDMPDWDLNRIVAIRWEHLRLDARPLGRRPRCSSLGAAGGAGGGSRQRAG